ncbi:MAG: hypothetical protein KH415_18005 [Clostridium sp.]|nr:hypothetical protein [Clostridium sp.]
MSREDLKQLDFSIQGRRYFYRGRRCPQLDIAFNRFYDTYYVFAGANNSLANAENKKLNIKSWETNNDEMIRTFIRGEYLKSTMQSYKAIEDYMMHAITFAFNLKNGLDSKNTYKNKSKKLYYNKVCELIEANNNHNTNLSKVKDIISNFHNNKDIKDIWKQVNNLKHNNNLWFSETIIPRPIRMQHLSSLDVENATIKFDSKWFEPERISLEEYVDKCYKVNIVIRKYVHDIYNCIVEEYSDYGFRKVD